MNSALYFGKVRHRRFTPKPHAFTYGLFMVYLDLDELDRVFAGRWFWSTRRAALARFKRADHFGDPAQPLADAVRAQVESETGIRPAGPIRLLTHLRYFGYVINPISFYYCFDADDTHVTHVLLEVTNTPWGERICYVLTPPPGARMEVDFTKAMHVSPFMAMDYTYRAQMSTPREALAVQLENHNASGCTFDATLTLKRRPINGASLAHALVFFPLMTLKVLFAIYFEAFRLWRKGIPYVEHPNTLQGAARQETTA